MISLLNIFFAWDLNLFQTFLRFILVFIEKKKKHIKNLNSLGHSENTQALEFL